MRTGKYFKYLMAMIIALGTTVNAMAQERNLKIYFSKYVEGGPAVPQMLITDDNNTYDIPAGITISSEGLVWATSHRLFEGWHGSNTDRLLADYKDATNMESHLKLSFGNFPYEVNAIQMNAMNDLFSGSLSEIFQINELNTTCTPVSGNAISSSDDSWALNVLKKEISFQTVDLPGFENRAFDGLRSFEVGEKIYRVKFRFGWPPFEKGNRVKIGDKDRTFIKAGWNGVTGTGSNIHDSDDENWAFKVKFTLPDVRMRCKKIATGSVDNNIIVQEEGVHRLEGYISAHPGAVQGKIDDPQDPDDFHFEYTVADADKSKIEVKKYTGEITKVYLFVGCLTYSRFAYVEPTLDSVPYMYRGRYVDVRYTEQTVEIYYDHQRVASHPKFPDYVSNQYHTNPSDMPDEFNRPEMNDERMLSWAETIGPNTKEVIARVFRSVQIKEQGYNAALSILNLSKNYPNDRFEDACQIALGNTTSPRYKYLKAILSSKQDIIAKERAAKESTKENHSIAEESGAFVRGASYYGGGESDDQ